MTETPQRLPSKAVEDRRTGRESPAAGRTAGSSKAPAQVAAEALQGLAIWKSIGRFQRLR